MTLNIKNNSRMKPPENPIIPTKHENVTKEEKGSMPCIITKSQLSNDFRI
jgi:hypothetical protein